MAAIGAPISLITQIAIYTLYGAGVNLLVGYTGLVPFGASVFFGCASYAVAIAMRGVVGNEIVALVFAMVFSLLLAAGIARDHPAPARPVFLPADAGVFADRLRDRLQVDRRHRRRERPAGRAAAVFAGDWSFHVFTIVAVALGMCLLWRIAHAPFGRLLQALRDNEQRVQSLGYNTFRIKFEAFVIMGGVRRLRRRAARASCCAAPTPTI